MGISEKGYKDFLKGMRYKDIAKKHGVKYNTVRVWACKKHWAKRKARTEREIEGQAESQIKENYSKVLEDTIVLRLKIENRISKLIDNSLEELENNRRITIDLKLLDKIARINKSSSEMLKIFKKDKDNEETENKVTSEDVYAVLNKIVEEGDNAF